MQTPSLDLKHLLAINLAGTLRRWFGEGRADGFGIFNYHRVTPHIRGTDPPTWNVTPVRFREQLSGLLDLGFRPWPLSQAVRAVRQGHYIPNNIFCVTFDDGYQNNYSDALPILKSLDIPATVFLATGFVGTEGPFAFDDWSEAGTSRVPPESWKPLTIEQCEQMLNTGLIEFGSHTHSHCDFCDNPDKFAADLETSVEYLEREFGISRPTFAFPFGYVTDDLFRAAEAANISCALTIQQHLVTVGDDPYRLGRFKAKMIDTSSSFAAKLDGWYARTQNAWQWVRHPIQQAFET